MADDEMEGIATSSNKPIAGSNTTNEASHVNLYSIDHPQGDSFFI